MSNTIIEVENLGKKYLIKHQQQGSYNALRDVITDKVKSFGKKIISPWNHKQSAIYSRTEEFWALKDVSFKVKQGEVIGIIGRNGAGKSTLLKIISRITEPTEGRIRIKGRVASLLEVGTGFHPELTGRENIFLNGAILGMGKAEIKKKFDEIVDFAEIEKFLDTPVKRYSSGMYVRLAFAVAAHLEPEILVVDEVLAVGDTEFQKKCLGKMQNVAKRERTVLFVSHNMGAVSQLCNRAVLLENGRNILTGNANQVVREYLKSAAQNGAIDIRNAIGTLTSVIEFEELFINGMNRGNICISPSSEINIYVKGFCKRNIQFFRTSFSIYKNGVRIFTSHDINKPQLLPAGTFKSEITVPAYFLRPGDYTISFGGHDGGNTSPGRDWVFLRDVSSFSILEEWNANNDFANVGIVNVPCRGKRTTI